MFPYKSDIKQFIVAGTGIEPAILVYDTKLVTITINPHSVEMGGVEPPS